MDYTTLQRIKDHRPCSDGWSTLLKTLNKSKADKVRLSFKRILGSNGLDDALWALRTHKDECKVRLFAADCAERVLYLFEDQNPGDKRPRLAIEAARQFARGEIDDAAWDAARAAAWDAAWDAARAAAGDAARAAAGAAAGAAARAAAGAAAWDAARAAAWDAAWGAEQQAQTELYIKYFC